MGEKQDKVEELAHHKVGKVPRVVVEDGLVVLHKLLNDCFLKILKMLSGIRISPHLAQIANVGAFYSGTSMTLPEQLHHRTWRPH